MIVKPRNVIRNQYLKYTNNVAVLGGGSWATALVKILTENKRKVHWYMRNEKAKLQIEKTGRNPHYLTSTLLRKKRLHISTDINEVTEKANLIILTIPTAFLDQELVKIKCNLKEKLIVSAVKGVVPRTLQIVGPYLHDQFAVSYDNIAVIAGPSHAEEVAMEKLSYLTIAAQDTQKAEFIASLLKTSYVRTKVSNDIIGTEYAAMLKNIYAIAAGIAHGLSYGDNFQSVLMSNAIREMKRYIRNVHKLKRNINNSAYLGDLLVTGYSIFSRNRTFGNFIGKGYTVTAAQAEMNMVAEGYYASKSAKLMSTNFRTRTPIIDAVYDILYQGKSPEKTFQKLSKKLN
ncbi:MAG: NAD(P)H-dependent glycerol-3-phosphate dehydrogenase [Flavobacteriaceae bacterium]